MLKRISLELKEHSPFTLLGTLSGLLLMMFFRNMSHETANTLFYVFHPLHICLSAVVTTALCKKYLSCELKGWKLFLKVFVIGYLGSIVIGTLSDSLIPFWGEILLNMPHRHAHIGFIEKWWLINPLVVLAITLAYFKPFTKLPHAGHVLLSTWASLFHMLMASGNEQATPYFGIFVFLFLAVWIPCCVSDIIFPLLFVRDKEHKKTCSACSNHPDHS